MKYTLAILALALTACNTTTENTSPEAGASVEATRPSGELLASTMVSNKTPAYANTGLFMKTEDWKDKHFENPNKLYGNVTYFYFSTLAKVASAECGLALDAHYVSMADAIGRRAIFQNKEAGRAKAKQVDAKFIEEYGPFDKNSPKSMCPAMQKNIAEQTLLGALFFVK